MKLGFFLPVLCLSISSTVGPLASAAEPLAAKPLAAKPSLGINLNGPADFNTEIPFVDAFKLARAWVSQKKGQPFGKGPALDLDENGWIKKLEPDCWAETLVLTVSGRLPEGVYTVLYDGEGRIEIKGGSGTTLNVDDQGGGKILVHVTPSPVKADSPITFILRETNPDNHLRNIRFLLPGHEENYESEPFRPGFLEMWKGVSVFRFMDWMKTNDSKISKWSERPTLKSATWNRGGGVPLEVMIDLCNRQKAAAWFCMPHLADDDYVRNFASMVREKLDPSLKVYIEMSNEVWNGQFEQSKWASEQGTKAGLAGKPWEAGWSFYARRSVEIFKIWEEVFGGKDRLVRVLGSQAANTHVGNQIVSFEEAAAQADAIAIAPYVSLNISPQGSDKFPYTAEEVSRWSVDQVMEELTSNRLPAAIKNIEDYKALADEHGLLLLAYEGGQHAVGIRGAENNETLTALLHEANRSEAMGKVYDAYLAAWKSAGGDVMAIFSSIGRWSKWGSWGLMEYYDSEPKDYPKFLSTMRWAKSLGQPVNAP